MKRKNVKKGFTLIEVLIVIAIIALIIGLLLPNYNQLRRQSRDQNRKAGVKAWVEAFELYKLNQSPPSYPTDAVFSEITPGAAWEEGSITYLNQTPKDPLYDTDDTRFYYRYSREDVLSYYIGVCLEDENDAEGRSSPKQDIFDDDYCDSDKWYYKTEP